MFFVKIKLFARGIIVIFVAYVFSVIIMHFVMMSQLEVVENNSDFPTTELFNVSENRIVSQSVVYNKKKIIEYDCCIDSFYLVNVIKIGTMLDSLNIFKNIHFLSKEEFPFDKESYIYSKIFIPNLGFIGFALVYDIRLLPDLNVENINIYLEGTLLNQDTLTNHALSYAIQATAVSYEFNNSNETNMTILHFRATDNKVLKKIALPISKLVFYKSLGNILYIMNISTLDDSEPDISKILKL